MSPYGSSIISGNKQHASRTALYLVRDACLILEERPKLFLYAWIQLLTFPQCTVFQTGCSPWGSRWGSKPVEQHMRILRLQLLSRREGSSRQKAKNQTYTSAFTLLRRPAGLCPGWFMMVKGAVIKNKCFSLFTLIWPNPYVVIFSEECSSFL